MYATNIIRAIPNIIGLNTYPRVQNPLIAQVNAVAPPGGCTVPVTIMTVNANATDIAHANQFMSSNIPKESNTEHTDIPTNADNRCPKNTFLGLENFASGAP